jgi:hypothetical protein
MNIERPSFLLPWIIGKPLGCVYRKYKPLYTPDVSLSKSSPCLQVKILVHRNGPGSLLFIPIQQLPVKKKKKKEKKKRNQEIIIKYLQKERIEIIP